MSGRHALGVILKTLKGEGVTRLYLPAYLCESVVQAAQASGLEVLYYPIGEDLSSAPPLQEAAATLVIHYHGWLHSDIVALRRQAMRGEGVLVEDGSQALLTQSIPYHGSGAYTFLSARKYLPCVLGGWCDVEANVPPPSPALEAVAWQAIAGRLARGRYLGEGGNVDHGVEQFYLATTVALETYLDMHDTPEAAPLVVRGLAFGVDREAVAERRRTNWRVMQEVLRNKVEAIHSDLPEGVVPLGFVVRLPEGVRDDVRRRLRESRVFAPVHWPLPAQIDPESFPEAASLSRRLLTLPIDQRYTSTDMRVVARLFLDALSS
jgi:hypothetical protein